MNVSSLVSHFSLHIIGWAFVLAIFTRRTKLDGENMISKFCVGEKHPTLI